jgi:hypothetical protein
VLQDKMDQFWQINSLQKILKLDSTMISLFKWGITRWLMGVGTHKGANMITLQKECESFLVFFHFFIWEFLNKIFCNLVIKNTYSCPNISHVLSQSLLNKHKIFKVCKLCQILCFILKFYHSFESYQIMLIILGFFFLYHELQLCFVCHAHNTPFTCGKTFLKF